MSATGSFFSRRWRGEVPVRTLFWRDMLGVGTGINLLATFVALMAASQGAATWLAAAIHLAPLPYNLFLVAAVNRVQPRPAGVVLVALVWLATMTVV